MSIINSWRGMVCGAIVFIILLGCQRLLPQPPAAFTTEPSPEQRLESFRKETPAARLLLVQKLPQAWQEFHEVTYSSLLVPEILAGRVDSSSNGDVYCRARAYGCTTVATTIKWVIDDGSEVKGPPPALSWLGAPLGQGDVLVVLDDSPYKERLASQEEACRKADAGRDQAEKELRELRAAKVEARLGEMIQARAKEMQAYAKLQSSITVAMQEATQREDLEKQVQRCVIRAPRDGKAFYYVNEQFRGGQAIIAEGEPVREGQKLIEILDRKNVLVNIKVPETNVSCVLPGQMATIRVGAFPNRVLHGKVVSVATVPDAQDTLLSGDIKVYTTRVAIRPADIEGLDLRPGMSANVDLSSINVNKKIEQVLTVPIRAVVTEKRSAFVFVKTRTGIEERTVVTGLSNNVAVEIKEGLRDGDFVLSQPVDVLRRLDLKPARKD